MMLPNCCLRSAQDAGEWRGLIEDTELPTFCDRFGIVGAISVVHDVLAELDTRFQLLC